MCPYMYVTLTDLAVGVSTVLVDHGDVPAPLPLVPGVKDWLGDG